MLFKAGQPSHVAACRGSLRLTPGWQPLAAPGICTPRHARLPATAPAPAHAACLPGCGARLKRGRPCAGCAPSPLGLAPNKKATARPAPGLRGRALLLYARPIASPPLPQLPQAARSRAAATRPRRHPHDLPCSPCSDQAWPTGRGYLTLLLCQRTVLFRAVYGRVSLRRLVLRARLSRTIARACASHCWHCLCRLGHTCMAALNLPAPGARPTADPVAPPPAPAPLTAPRALCAPPASAPRAGAAPQAAGPMLPRGTHVV